MQSKVLPELIQASRHLQQTLAPIVGTGVGDPDTVLLGGTEEEACKTLVPSSVLGQVCYKVVGSALVYTDESMYVTPKDIQTLALETLTVGMNYAATDFTQLDPDIFGLFLVQGYDEAPDTTLAENFDSNQRPWTPTAENPFVNLEEAEEEKGRSGGAKFGIAFATLLFIALFLLLCVYIFKNHRALFGDVDWENCCCCLCFGGGGEKKLKPNNQNKHVSLDDITVPSTKYEASRGRVGQDASGLHPELNISVRDFNASPESTGTRPLSPDPETPRNVSPQQPRQQEAPSYLEESNIYSPRSDWSRSSARSTISIGDSSEMVHSTTSDDRMHMKLSKQTIRGSHRKPSQMISPARSYDIQDTVEL